MVAPADAVQIYCNRGQEDQIRFKDISDEKFFLLTDKTCGLSISCMWEKNNKS